MSSVAKEERIGMGATGRPEDRSIEATKRINSSRRGSDTQHLQAAVVCEGTVADFLAIFARLDEELDAWHWRAHSFVVEEVFLLLDDRVRRL